MKSYTAMREEPVITDMVIGKDLKNIILSIKSRCNTTYTV